MRNLKTNIADQKYGFTMVEMVVVIFLIALIAWAVFPLLKTSFEAWEIADRRTEIAQIGRVGMSQFTREIRKAWDLTDASEPTYIDYNPIWASASEYRFEYATTQYEFNYGATSGGSFSSNTLSYPVEDFTYAPYSRRIISSGVTRARRVNFIWASLSVSDERRKLPATIDPRSFRSMVQMRIAREGYFFAKDLNFSTQSTTFDRSDCDSFCVKTFSDRIDPPMDPPGAASATVNITFGGGPCTFDLSYASSTDYYAGCIIIGKAAVCGAGACNVPQGNRGVIIRLDDDKEFLRVDEEIEVKN